MNPALLSVVIATAATVAFAGPPGLPAHAAEPPAAQPGSGALMAAQLGIGIEAHPGYIRVTEVLHLENPLDRGVVGEVTIPLPPSARFVTYHEGLFQPRVTSDRIIDRVTIAPGIHRVVYAYSVVGAGEIDLGRQVASPIAQVDVLTIAPVAARSDVLTAVPPVTTQGRTYLRASGRVSAAGAFALSVTGVPVLRRSPAPVAAGVMGAILLTGVIYAMSRAGVGGASWKRIHRS